MGVTLAEEDGWELWFADSRGRNIVYYIDHVNCPSERGLGYVPNKPTLLPESAPVYGKCNNCGGTPPESMYGMIKLMEWER